MDKGYLLKLTQAVYRVTEAFPEAEPLKFKIRETVNEILTNLVLFNPTGKEKILKEIEILENYFEIARIQYWVNPLNFLILGQEYQKIKEELGKTELKEGRDKKAEIKRDRVEINRDKVERRVRERSFPVAPVAGEARPQNERHEKILEILKEKGKTQVWEVKQILPEVSKRTLRRDFDYLLKQGKIERIGERNNTSYQLKGIGHTKEIGQEVDVLL